MRIVQLLIPLILSSKAFDQQLENRMSISILAGAKTRITLIYLKRIPDVVTYQALTDVQEQPDKHLSGPGMDITEKYETVASWSFALKQTIRYDYIYQRLPLDYPIPNGFEFTIKQKVLFDLYADMAKDIDAKNSTFTIILGFAVCGLNSGFTQSFRYHRDPNILIDTSVRKNFIFPAGTIGFGWQKNRFYGELKFGYCWDNPTLYNSPFLFPEIRFQYQLFRFINEK